MKKSPLVSVVMSVYNGEKYLRQAIDSILNQTFKDFEFIIIDDGSKDKSREIINSYHDPRIKLISRENKGLTFSLNEGIKKAKGKYVARMDADDISHLDRLALEVKRMEEDLNLGLIGSNYTVISLEGNPLATTDVFTHPDDLKVAETLSNQYGHGSVMMRKSVLDKVGLYDKAVGVVEDYDLFTRISHVAKIANIKKSLYFWRSNPKGVSRSNYETQLKLTDKIIDREFRYMMNNRRKYKIISSFHPDSWKYLYKKANLFYDLAFFYRKNDKLLESYIYLILSIVLAPWRRRSYKYLLLLPWRDLVLRDWRYVYL